MSGEYGKELRKANHLELSQDEIDNRPRASIGTFVNNEFLGVKKLSEARALSSVHCARWGNKYQRGDTYKWLDYSKREAFAVEQLTNCIKLWFPDIELWTIVKTKVRLHRGWRLGKVSNSPQPPSNNSWKKKIDR